MHCGSGEESFEENMRSWSRRCGKGFRFAIRGVPRSLGSMILPSKSTRSAANGASMHAICVEAKRPTQKRPASMTALGPCQVLIPQCKSFA